MHKKKKPRPQVGTLRSKAQVEKFKQLLADGRITQLTFDNWMNQTAQSMAIDGTGGIQNLPDRLQPEIDKFKRHRKY